MPAGLLASSPWVKREPENRQAKAPSWSAGAKSVAGKRVWWICRTESRGTGSCLRVQILDHRVTVSGDLKSEEHHREACCGLRVSPMGSRDGACLLRVLARWWGRRAGGLQVWARRLGSPASNPAGAISATGAIVRRQAQATKAPPRPQQRQPHAGAAVSQLPLLRREPHATRREPQTKR